MIAADIHVSPSGLQRALNCTGQPLLAEGLPNPSSEQAQLGTIAHDCILSAVNGGDLRIVMDKIDALEGIAIDLQTAEKWQLRAADLIQLIGKKPSKLEVESKLSEQLQLLGMKPKGREGEHQADLIWNDKGWNVLDYKNGKTPVPEPSQNDQVLSYAWALMKREKLKNPDEIIDLWIYQPEISREVFHGAVTVAYLKKWGEHCMDKIEEMQTGGQLQEGAWCTWCPVAKAGACPIIQRRKDNRREAVDGAKAGAAEMGQQLALSVSDERKVGELIALPKTGADITIPDDVLRTIQKLVSMEQEMLAVSKGNELQASASLKEAGIYEGKLDEIRALMKKPYLDAGKAVDEAFRAPIAQLAGVKAGYKGKLQSWLEIQERARRQEEARQKAEQDRLAAELFAKEQEALKLQGEARKKADEEAAKIRNAATEASVVPPPAEPRKIAGIAAKEVFSFTIPEVGKIPDRYLIKHEGPLQIVGVKPTIIVQVDGAVLAKDAAAGRLKAATWLSYTSGKAVSAR